MIGETSGPLSGLPGYDGPSSFLLDSPSDGSLWWTTLDWEDDAWRDQAACKSTAADLFFPTGRTPGASEQVRAAKSVCRQCEVRATCLLYALETNQDAGIWGGTSEDERRKLRRAWLARRRKIRPAIG
jgi:WhiB family redox-sensing transcriptional regulator